MNSQLCRDFVHGRCTRAHCKFSHDTSSAQPHHTSPDRRKQPKKDKYNKNKRKAKNTESFEPMARPVDMRIVMDLGHEKLTTNLTERDVLLVPNLFRDFAPGELYQRLQNEIQNCGVPNDQLLKLWHGDTHYIADDHTKWKENAPTFAMVLDRIRTFFGMRIQATRFNWYKDTSQWKPFHHDQSALRADSAKKQNFTVAVSFGATRDAAFEEVESKKVISMPQPDGTMYCFAKITNILWKHGILKEKEVREEGRISVIAWGWVDVDRL